MKSAGNGGVVQSRLQVLHVHVFLAAQLGARRVAKSGADQHQGGVPVRECPHHTGAAADLTVQPLDHVVGTDAGPMLAGKIAVGQRFLCTIFSDIVCCLLSEWCVVTSFYQSLQAMSSFMHFPICATYCTLSCKMQCRSVFQSQTSSATRHSTSGWLEMMQSTPRAIISFMFSSSFTVQVLIFMPRPWNSFISSG